MACRDDVTRRGADCQWHDAVTVMVRHWTHVTQPEHITTTTTTFHYKILSRHKNCLLVRKLSSKNTKFRAEIFHLNKLCNKKMKFWAAATSSACRKIQTSSPHTVLTHDTTVTTKLNNTLEQWLLSPQIGNQNRVQLPPSQFLAEVPANFWCKFPPPLWASSPSREKVLLRV